MYACVLLTSCATQTYQAQPIEPAQAAAEFRARSLDDEELREYLLAQINRFGGNISRTAEFVGMERSALHRKLRALGRDAGGVLAAAQSAENKQRLKDATDEAKALGIFGSPSFVVDGELFWGDDRLEEALAWARGA